MGLGEIFGSTPHTRTAENNRRTADRPSLFSCLPNRKGPRISAANEMPLADNLLQKTAKTASRARARLGKDLRAVTVLHLLRHGEHVLRGRVIARRTPAVGLSARGRAEIAAAADRLADAEIAALCSSPLRRARESA